MIILLIVGLLLWFLIWSMFVMSGRNDKIINIQNKYKNINDIEQFINSHK